MLTRVIYFFIFLCGATGLAQSDNNELNKNNYSQKISTSNNLQIVVPKNREQKFQIWKLKFIQKAIEMGFSKGLTETFILPAVIEEKALERDKQQPEFNTPIWSYLDRAGNPNRLKNGIEKLRENEILLNKIEDKYKVSRHVLVAIWGLESAFGEIMGNYNPVNSLSTFAFEGRRSKFGEQQLLALLSLLRDGYVQENQLMSSWAGAMGMMQFIPTTFRDYAIDFDNDGNKDLWNNKSDALSSAAHYLSRHGWQWEEPVVIEVNTKQGFDFSVAENSQKTVNEWLGLGVTQAKGQDNLEIHKNLKAKLIVPSGHRGPKILVFKNFDVIKKYNNSTSYALAVISLANSFNEKATITAEWPRSDKPLSLADRTSAQKKLKELGYKLGEVDGVIGPNSRRAIQQWQKDINMPEDGYLEKNILDILLK